MTLAYDIIPPQSAPVNQPDRALLARVADSVFWTARYVERTEHTSRLLWVMTQLLMDVGDLDPALQDRQWLGLLDALEVRVPKKPRGMPLAERCVRTLAFDESNPSSILSGIARARENARSVRSEISAEMWGILNETYWSLQGGGAIAMYEESADNFFQYVVKSSMLFQGTTDQTLAHGQRWCFAQVGKLLERIDVTCRVIDTRVRFLTEAGPRMETPLRNIHLMAALRMCCSIEAYRRQHLNELDVFQVAGFLLLQADHPRSVRYAVEHARRAVELIRTASGTGVEGVDAAERVLGRLAARLAYGEIREIMHEGIGGYLASIRTATAEANHALQRRYFMG